MSERKFTWFPKMTRVVSSIPNETDRCRLIMAIIEYGTYGTEPSLEYPICSIFEGLRDDIDNSVGARERNRGGRPKKEETENGGFEPTETQETGVSIYKNGGFEVSETQETGVSTSENGGFRVLENPETGVSEHKNGGFAVSENPETPPLYTNPVHTSTDHTNTNQTKPREKPPYPLACLAILNEELKTAYGMLPPKASTYLQSMQDRYSLDEVRAMVAYKRDEWKGTKFELNLTPNTLFSAEHFEQYIHQSKAERGNRNAASSRSFDEEFLGKALSSV